MELKNIQNIQTIQKNIIKLPLEIIITHIIPYTYEFQTKELINDIHSFYNVKEYLKKVYYERWKNTFEYEINADLNWLDNDINRFFNEDVPTMLGYKNNCIEKYKRLYILHNKKVEKIHKYISKRRKAIQNINILLGILNPIERIKLIDFALSLENE